MFVLWPKITAKSEATKNLHRLATGFRHGVLNRKKSVGHCWTISSPLTSLLRMLGHECELIEGSVSIRGAGEHHFWIALSDGRILDPTADQFNHLSGLNKQMPRVYIGPLPKWYRRSASVRPGTGKPKK